MLSFLPTFIICPIALVLYISNLIIIPLVVFIIGVLRLILPIPSLQRLIDWIIQNIMARGWLRFTNFVIWLTTNTKWDVQGKGNLRRTGKYFLICNHQSWIDILVLYKVFGKHVPILVFFMKQQLLWMLPILGFACWTAGFPFMKRYSKAYLKKHPEKKGQDMETTKKLCKRYETQPVTLISFLEATRFTQEKRQHQRSPYKHLLKPKASSLAFVLAAMEKSLHEIINVTIIYPDGKIGLKDFICGKIKKIIIRYEILPIDASLRGDYYKDREIRRNFQNWLNKLWEEKDKIIENLNVGAKLCFRPANNYSSNGKTEVP